MSDVIDAKLNLTEIEKRAVREALPLLAEANSYFRDKGAHDAADNIEAHETHLQSLLGQAETDDGVLLISRGTVYALRAAEGRWSIAAGKKTAARDEVGAREAVNMGSILDSLTNKIATALFGPRR